MVKVKEDLTGRRFGRLTVVCQTDDYVSKNGIHYAKYLCQCNCSQTNNISVMGADLISGKTQSCGCLHKERTSKSIYLTHKKI